MEYLSQMNFGDHLLVGIYLLIDYLKAENALAPPPSVVKAECGKKFNLEFIEN